MEYYKQCKVIRSVEGDKFSHIQVTWLPIKYAVLGKVLKLKNDQGEWEDGWEVVEASDATPENVIPDVHAGVKAHRKATGDSLKK